ncbi:MAG: protein translocase SEC61 complex subunit gamma [Thermoplasmata archaeon]|jgi:protein transport protein SEC61 subunit gamma-like protein|nr:MAG: protein translocase SEC61 complex subunit gamma [Thermoplasmata archaeon]
MSKIIDKAWEVQTKIEKRFERVGKGKYGRVLKMARKPETDEYIKTSEMTAIGIAIIGFIGFTIYLLATKVAPWIGNSLGL